MRYNPLKLFVVFLAFFVLNLNAEDVHRADGYVYKNVKDLQRVDDIFIFSLNGRSYTLSTRRIKVIYDRSGNIIFEHMELTAQKVVFPGSPMRFIFKKNGKRVTEGKWIDSGVFKINQPLPSGVYKQYLDSGRLERSFSVADGKLNGPCKVYFASGQPKEVGEYKDNHETGVTKSYYPTGELKGEASYENGVKVGLTKLYYRSGMLQMEVQFKNNVPVGVQKLYFESGKLQMEVAYKNGLKSGPVKSYYESGKVSMTGNFVEGKENGNFVTFYESGRPKKTKKFVMGRILKMR